MPREDTKYVGPIIVSHEVPRRHLEEQGTLVTFRKKARTTGESWWKEEYSGPKRGDCTVEWVCDADISDSMDVLEPYVDESGFDSLDEWRQAIEQIYTATTTVGELYRITLLYPTATGGGA